jgi:hypothetical protein
MEGSQTANLCIAHGLTTGEASQTASTSNGQISNLKVAITNLTFWLPIALRSDREVHKIFQWLVFEVWAINTHPSRARYLSWSCELHTWLLGALSFLIQAFLDPLWMCEILLIDLSVLDLCGTSDSLSKHHRLISIGGYRLLDGLEEWKPWALQEDCECGLVFLWEVLCSPRRSGEEQL